MNLQSNLTLHSGTVMPIIGLGTWQLSDDTAGTIETALQLGYSMIDTSGDYGTQPGIGEGIKLSGAARDSFYLVTKVEETDDAYAATRKNLDELGLEYADLLLIHRPPEDSAGEKLWAGLLRAKREGMVRDIGVSNYSKKQIKALIDASGEAPTINQIEWSPFGHSEDMLKFCRENEIIIQAYSPLTRTQRLHDQNLQELASKYGKTPAQIVIRWNLQLGTVPIVKANRQQHLQENIDVFDFELSEGDMAVLGGLNEHYSSLG